MKKNDKKNREKSKKRKKVEKLNKSDSSFHFYIIYFEAGFDFARS